jgi:tRNA dimethylallyltransferase
MNDAHHSGLAPLDKLLIVIVGPTAIGKTGLSVDIAETFNAPVISADSRQFYREMKIGTAVPEEYDLNRVPHFMIGHLSIAQDYNAYRYETEVLKLLDEIYLDHSCAVLVGGSGLYVNAVLNGIDELPDPDPEIREHLNRLLEQEGIGKLQSLLNQMDPAYFSQVDKNNPKRLMRALEVCMATGQSFSSLRKNNPMQRKFRAIRIGLNIDRQLLYERINARVDRMIAEGLVEEARSLYPYRHLNPLNTVGYKELFGYFDGLVSLDKAIEQIKFNSRKYAKRQLTWFRKDKDVKWFDPAQREEIIGFIRTNSTDHLR